MALYQIKELSFAYPSEQSAKGRKKALNGVSLSVREGEWVLLCGKSGSGKSTLLRHLKPSVMPHGVRSGNLRYRGEDVSELTHRKEASEIGFLFQNPDNQIVTDEVWRELAFGLESLGVNRDVMRIRLAETATYFGMEKWFHKKVSQLSGGGKQLLNLAGLVATGARVLVLDEPTAQLDPIAVGEFHTMLQRIREELGVTIVMSEQRLDGVACLADRIVVLEEGTLLMDGSPKEVGEWLKEKEHAMFLAMPSPARIYARIGTGADCPLTVREGREWIKGEMAKTGRLAPSLKDRSQEGSVCGKPKKRDVALSLKDVWFRYDKKGEDVLKGLSMKVPKGAVTAIVGGNGTGKTSLLHLLSGVLKPNAGKRWAYGKGESVISCLPQSPSALFVHDTARKEWEEMEREEAALKEMAAFLHLDDVWDRHPLDLSGGEQQRLALGKVLLTKPDVLLLDEPTKGMDAQGKLDLGRRLLALKEKGKTIVVVSHDLEFCAEYSQYAALLFDGEISVMGETAKVFSGNRFYTTPANRMAKEWDAEAITDGDVVRLLKNACGK